jgi:hypothetical protein
MAVQISADTPEELLAFAFALAGVDVGDTLVPGGEPSDDGVPDCVVMREDGEEEPERLTLSPDFHDLDDDDITESIARLVESARGE